MPNYSHDISSLQPLSSIIKQLAGYIRFNHVSSACITRVPSMTRRGVIALLMA